MPVCEQWSEWNECSTSDPCTEGVRSRERHCPDSPSLEKEPCVNNCTYPGKHNNLRITIAET